MASNEPSKVGKAKKASSAGDAASQNSSGASKNAKSAVAPKKKTSAPVRPPAAAKRCMPPKKALSIADVIIRYLIVFLIPTITVLVIYHKKKIAPFGDNSVLSVDLWGQYFPIYQQFGRNMSFSKAMYAWTGALGYNNYVQSAFYARSIFMTIFKFVPFKSSISFINYVSLLRFGLSAITCQMFLEYKYKQKNPIIMSISVCYSLCAYAIAFIMQFIWTDCIFLVPLVLLGLEMLLNGKSPLLYVTMLAFTIYTSFYIGFGTCLFTAFYFIAEMVKRAEFDPSRKGFSRFTNCRELGMSTLKFAVYSILAGMLNAVILIPTLMGLSHSLPANEGKLDFSRWYHTFSENAASMLPMTKISLEFGVANIATGLIMFLLLPLYFMNYSIKFKDKLASGAFLGILYCGLNYCPADYVFNGFHFPNQLPGRWSFMFSLAVVIVAAEGVSKFKGINIKSTLSAWIIGTFFVFFSRYGGITADKEKKFKGWIYFLGICAILILFYSLFKTIASNDKKKQPEKPADVENELPAVKNAPAEQPKRKKISKRAVRRVLTSAYSLTAAILICYEACTNAYTVGAKLNGGFGTSNMKNYLKVNEVIRDFGEKYECGDKDFYRCESNLCWTYDDGMLGGYNAITYYGSTLHGGVFTLMRYLGNGMYAQNVSTVYNNTSPIQNSLFGIKYFVDRAHTMGNDHAGITLVEDNQYYKVWENETALPLAFGASPDINKFEITDEFHPLTTQNEIVNLLAGYDANVYEKITPTAFDGSNAQLDIKQNWNESFFYRIDHEQPVQFRYVYNCPNDQPVFLEHNFRAGSIAVEVNGNVTNLNVGNERFKYIGTFPTGTEIKVTVDVNNINIGCYGLDLYSLNMDKWKQLTDGFKESGLKISSFENTKIKGSINMKNTGMVFTSIPQDGGWSVYVDGKKVKTSTFADALITFSLAKGDHDIEIKYRCPGFVLGLCITVIALLMTIGCLVFRKRFHKSLAAKAEAKAKLKAAQADETAEEAGETVTSEEISKAESSDTTE